MNGKVMNRNFVVLGAVLIQLCLGAIYAWSVFTPFLVPQSPRKDKETGEYVDRVVFVMEDDVRVGIPVPKKPKQRPDEKIIEVDVLVPAEGGVPENYPFDDSELVEASVPVAVEKDHPEGKLPFHLPLHRSASIAKWTKAQSQIVFSAGLASFAIVMVLAGRMMPVVGPRNLAIAGGVVLGAGYLLAGLLGASNFWVSFLFVGVVGGAGIGLAYVVPIAVGMRWFPDRKGLITGLAVAGFGFGALLWVKLAGTWGFLLASYGVNTTFMIYGALFLVATVIGSVWMIFPPEGYRPANWTPPEAVASSGDTPARTVELTSGRMLATPQFYMILLCFAFGASAGLMSIGLMKLFPMTALTDAGYTDLKASAIAGTAMAVFFSLANGIGRIAWGTISDYLGAKMSIVIMMATQGVFVILFQWMAGHEYALYLGATLIGFNFGGNFALFPMITATTFGTKHVGQNYGWVFLAYGAGGIFGPILGGYLGDLGNFPLAFTICGVLCLAAAGIIAGVKAPQAAATTEESAAAAA